MRNEFSVGWKIIIFSILVKYFNSEKTICLGSFGEGNDSISFLLFFFFPQKRWIQSFKSSIPCTHPPPSVISVLTKRGWKQSKRTEGKNWVTSCIWAASPHSSSHHRSFSGAAELAVLLAWFLCRWFPLPVWMSSWEQRWDISHRSGAVRQCGDLVGAEGHQPRGAGRRTVLLAGWALCHPPFTVNRIFTI